MLPTHAGHHHTRRSPIKTCCLLSPPLLPAENIHLVRKHARLSQVPGNHPCPILVSMAQQTISHLQGEGKDRRSHCTSALPRWGSSTKHRSL